MEEYPEEDRIAGRAGGQSIALDAVETLAIGGCISKSVVGAALAGTVLMAYFALLYSGGDITRALRATASLLLSKDALSQNTPLGTVVLVGLLDHFVVAAFWGLVFGLVLACGRWLWTPGTVVTMGILFGAFVWLVDCYLLGPVFWPWMLDMSSFSEFIGHVFFFGLPMSAWVARSMSLPGA